MRDYDPSLGQFAERDPVHKNFGMRKWVNGDPLTQVDPTGGNWIKHSWDSIEHGFMQGDGAIYHELGKANNPINTHNNLELKMMLVAMGMGTYGAMVNSGLLTFGDGFIPGAGAADAAAVDVAGVDADVNAEAGVEMAQMGNNQARAEDEYNSVSNSSQSENASVHQDQAQVPNADQEHEDEDEDNSVDNNEYEEEEKQEESDDTSSTTDENGPQFSPLIRHARYEPLLIHEPEGLLSSGDTIGPREMSTSSGDLLPTATHEEPNSPNINEYEQSIDDEDVSEEE